MSVKGQGTNYNQKFNKKNDSGETIKSNQSFRQENQSFRQENQSFRQENQEPPKEITKETAQETSQEIAQETAKEASQEVTREITKETTSWKPMIVANCTKLNVRQSPSKSSDILHVLDVGTEVLMEEITKEWAHVRIGTTIEGFVMSEFIKEV